MKNDGQLGRNYMKGRHGDQANANLAAVGDSFRLILTWPRLLLRPILAALLDAFVPHSAGQTASWQLTIGT